MRSQSRRVEREIDRRSEADRNANKEGEERFGEGADDGRQGPENLCDRIPGGADEKSQAEALDGLPGAAEKLEDEDAGQDDNGQCKDRRQSVKNPVAEGSATPTPGSIRFTPRQRIKNAKGQRIRQAPGQRIRIGRCCALLFGIHVKSSLRGFPEKARGTRRWRTRLAWLS